MTDWDDVRRDLESLPQRPVGKGHLRNWTFRLKRGLDFIGHARLPAAVFFRTVNPYPKPFEHLRIETKDGVHIAGWYGPPTRRSSWGLVLVPGMFSTKDDTVHKRRAIRIWREWRIPVLAIDLRGFGESAGISTAGWKEAEDVQAAVSYLIEHAGVRSVSIMAESLGGAAALNAAATDGREDTGHIGAILTWSAFVDALDASTYISERPPKGAAFERQWAGFRRLLRLRSRGGYERFDAYLDDAAKVYGLPDHRALCAVASPKAHVSDLRCPTLLVHAKDDPVVPVRHARRMERYATQPHVQTLVLDWGGHTGFEAMDPVWFWEVTARFLGKANRVRLANLGLAKGRR